MRYYLLFAGLFFLSGSVPAFASQPGAESVLKEYLAHDASGARLDSETALGCDKLVTWQEEPGWDQLFLIASYEVMPGLATTDSATFIVSYTILGKEDGEEWKPSKTPYKEKQVFVLIREKGLWRINSPTIPPHVCKSALLKHARGLLALENQDSRRKKSLLKELHDLEKMK